MPLPKYTSSVLTRALKIEVVPYTDLASRYTGKTATLELPAIVTKHLAEYQAVRYLQTLGYWSTVP